MTGRIPSPHDKVNLVFQVLVNPLESGVDEGNGRIAICCFGAENACWSITTVAGVFLFRGRVVFVKGVGMKVW